MTLEELAAVEEIRGLKARYFYAVDTRDWALLESLITDEARIDFTSEPDLRGVSSGAGSVIEAESWTFRGGAEFTAWVAPLLENVISVHNGHDPIITLTGGETATGVWPMSDRLETQGEVFRGYGHYHDAYRRVESEWLISELTLTRLVAVVGEQRDTPLLPTKQHTLDARKG